MNKNYSCDIIKDLLPGYIDGVLSEAGETVVKEHLAECEKCNKVYLDMKEEWHTTVESNEQLMLDGMKKVQQRTRRLTFAVIVISSLMIFALLSIFMKIFVIGEPLSTHEISIDKTFYHEDTNSLEISGTVNLASCRISRIVWEPSKEDANAVNILIYGAETLPFQAEKKEFHLSIPDMQGKIAYLVCPDYDQQEIYRWEYDHYELLDELEDEIYRQLSELNREKDALNYIDGITSVNAREGICYSVHSVIGEHATYWRVHDMLTTDGDFNSRDFDIWISLDKPYQLYIYDYQTGKYTDDISILHRQ